MLQGWAKIYYDPNILYNIIKLFIEKQNIMLYIYYCKPAYPLVVNVEALQSQIFNISNIKIILSSQQQAKLK